MDTNQILLITAAAVGLTVWWQSQGTTRRRAPYAGTPSSELTASQRRQRAEYVDEVRWSDPEYVDAYMDYADQRVDYLDSEPEDAQFGVTFDTSTLPYDWAQPGWSP